MNGNAHDGVEIDPGRNVGKVVRAVNMKPDIAHCSKDHDYSSEDPRLEFSEGGRYLKLRFALSPAAQWNMEQFGRPVDARGKCKGFSRGSRKRLLGRLNQVSVAADLPAFVTMTLPDDVFRDDVAEFAKDAKRWLDVFFKRLNRVEPGASAVWRIEWQSRKSGKWEGKLFPHFHLLVWGLPKRLLGNPGEAVETEVWENFVRTPDNQLTMELLDLWAEPLLDAAPRSQKRSEWGDAPGMPAFVFQGSRDFVDRCEALHWKVWTESEWSEKCVASKDEYRVRNMSFQDWASLHWYHIVASQNLDHLSAGVRVERVRSWGGVMAYAAKYLGKAGDEFLSEIRFGRSWGIFNRASLPWGKMVELPLDGDMGIRLRRVMRHYLERRVGRRWKCPYGVTLYCDVEQFRKLWERPPPDPF